MNQPLAETIFWIAAAVCLLAELAILRFSFAARSGNKSELVPSAARGGEIAWAVIPALALVLVFGATWKRIEARATHMRMMDHSAMDHSMPMPASPDQAP
jgi:heme/copper-type cytochrome/quinol oxidase subunit 2